MMQATTVGITGRICVRFFPSLLLVDDLLHLLINSTLLLLNPFTRHNENGNLRFLPWRTLRPR